jgi:copper(I)-binding protein
LLLALGLVLGACSSSDDTAANCNDVAIENPWVRLPAGENTALYFDAVNEGSAEAAIVGASTEAAAAVELHETRAVDGVMEMEPVADQRVPIAGGETVSFEPGGLHVMVMGVTDLEEGQEVAFTIEFDGECTVTIDAPVHADTP